MSTASTGIVLRRMHRSGKYLLTRPGSDQPTEFGPGIELGDVARLAGLRNGYWLRDTPAFEERVGGRVVQTAAVWTWMQL